MLRFFGFPRRQPRTARGTRIYAIGDVHGRMDLLKDLLGKIGRHWEAADVRPRCTELVFLGDIIDRGTDSAGCLRLVHRLTRYPNVRLLKGNHEDLLLHSLAGNGVAQEVWLSNGGDSALASFGVAPPADDEDAVDFAERLREALPEPLVKTLETAPVTYRSGDYLFVHAGVRPGVPLRHQDERDLLFIRDEFTSSDGWHGAVIVHGHSIVEEVEFRSARIAVDTGAYRTGRLSCVCLDGTAREAITT